MFHFRNNIGRFIFIITCFFCLQTKTGLGQKYTSQPYFNHINTLQGLSSDNIRAIFRDRRGFLWIGTDNGLNKYDGRTITTFRHNRFNPQSIIANDINSITEDDSGYLWIGTNEGISKFDTYSKKSKNFFHQKSNPQSLNNNYNCIVYYDSYKRIWIGNASGLSFLDKESHQFKEVNILPDSLYRKHLSSVGQIMEDKEGRFWIGTYSGLVLFDRGKNTFRRFLLNGEDKSGQDIVTALFQDHQGRIWIGFWAYGLCLFHPETGKFSSFKWNKKSNYMSAVNIPFSIAETKSQNEHYTIWVGTSEGLIKIDSLPSKMDNPDLSLKTEILLPDDKNPHSLSIKNISCLTTDKQGIMWIGTSKGLNEFVPQNQLFANRKPIKGRFNRIRVDSSNGKLRYFVATWYGNGLTELDKNLKELHSWPKIPVNASNQDNGQINDVLVARNGMIWIGTFNGLYSFNEKTNRYKAFLHRKGAPNTVSDNRITALAEDKDNQIWIGTYGKGLNVLNPQTGKIVCFLNDLNNNNSLSGNLILDIFKDRQGQIWIATNKGLSLFNKRSNNFINYIDQEGASNSLKGNNVSGLIEDKHGIYWISTNEGLNRYDPMRKQFSLFSTEEGLKNNDVSTLVEDNGGTLWMGAGTGVSSFNPITRTFINYDEQNGLPYGKAEAMTLTPSGAIIVGINEQLISFNPKGFKKAIAPPPVYITDFTVSGNPVHTTRGKNLLEPIVLHYPDNNFSATFSAPDFINGKAVRYAYRLEGADPQWINSGNRNFVTYSGLEPGHYILHVKAANSEGIWNNKGVEIELTVLPPFWKTWWFQLVILSVLILIVYLLFVFRVRGIRKKEAMKTEVNKQMADMRLKVLRSRMNPHFMFNALNSIQECIYTGDTQSAYRYLSSFSKLVRIVLERSEQDFITIRQAVELLELYLQLEALRFQETFVYEIRQNGVDADFLKIPPMLIQPFVENAIWHGLHNKKGEKKLWITFNADTDYIYVTIQDNGIGRDEARLQKMDTLTQEMNYFDSSEKNSLGIKLVSEQLKTVSKKTNKEAEVGIEDLFEEDEMGNKISKGTKVTLIIPINE